MDIKMFENMDIRILGNEFCINTMELKKIEDWQQNWGCIKYIGLFINEQMFINEDAKKIFLNIINNCYEFVPEIRHGKECYPSVIIDTREKDYLECLKNIKLVQLMIKRANQISELIGNKPIDKNEGLLSRYKGLIEGVKTNYEKGLILVRLLFKNKNENDLLTNYYRYIQKKENFEVRRELFYQMLLDEQDILVKNETKLKKKR